MPEADLFPIVSNWLIAQGFRVYAEVHYKRHDIDVVGDKPGKQVAIELKPSFTRNLKSQLQICKRGTHWVYSCTFSMPRKKNLAWCKRMGIGVLVVKGRTLVVLSEPEQIGKSVTWINLKHAPQNIIGGVPSGEDKHPARDVYERISAYLVKNGETDWDEAFAAVPNHYAHAYSMQSSMMRYAEWNRLPLLGCAGVGSRRKS